jgi:murein DD-endopeptidase MepM/ murein hydrolase activator NlpD/N-acetylneuraminic acid mutarotase
MNTKHFAIATIALSLLTLIAFGLPSNSDRVYAQLDGLTHSPISGAPANSPVSLSASNVLTWTTRASMSTVRDGVGAAGANNGKIYAIGGWANGPLASVEEYDPATDTWRMRASMPTARLDHSVAMAGNGKIYAISGDVGGPWPFTANEEYDPTTDIWTVRAGIPTPRYAFGLAAASNGKLYAIGGANNSIYLATVEEYNPATDTWTTRANMPAARGAIGVATASNGKIYAVGGADSSNTIVATVEEYDPATDTWRARASMPTARARLGVVATSNGKLYAIGGHDSSGVALAIVEEYDPATDTWRADANMPTARYFFGIALGNNGKIYAIGGERAPYQRLAIVEEASFLASNTYSASGRVMDISGNPISGVTVSSSSGLSATTNASGYYTITSVITGMYTLTPSKSGYTFSPGRRTGVKVPPSKTELNFTATSYGGPPTPFLDLPFSYGGTSANFLNALQDSSSGRINSWFDHEYPNYRQNGSIYIYNGKHSTNRKCYDKDCTVVGYDGYYYDGHSGIDFRKDPDPKKKDTSILAAATGKVVAINKSCPTTPDADCGGGYGNYVILYNTVGNGNGYFTRYGHLNSITDTLKISDTVISGSELGIMGNSGHSGGTHLHFGVYRDNGNGKWDGESVDKVVDPFGWELNGPADVDPWVKDLQGPASSRLWKYDSATEQSFDGSQGTIITSSLTSLQATIAPNTFTGQAILELSVEPVANASAQLRKAGLSFWLRLLELLGNSGQQSISALQNSNEISLAQSITLTMSYSDTEMAHLDLSQLGLYQWDETLATWLPLSSTVDTSNQVVTATTFQLGAFSLQAPLLCPADSVEPDDNYYLATAIQADGISISKTFDIAQDEDWLQWETITGTTYIFQTSELAPNVDTVIQLYDVDGQTLLASDDNSGGGAASRLKWTAPTAGKYFVSAIRNSASVYGCNATYKFQISQERALYLPLVVR